MSGLDRSSFVFYKSFFQAIDECPIDNQRNIYRAIALYALQGEETQLSGIEKAVFIMAKPQIDANTVRYLNGSKPKTQGSKGGAPKGNQNARKQKRNNTETTSNVNDNDNVNDELVNELADAEDAHEIKQPPNTIPDVLSGKCFYSNRENRDRLDAFAESKGFSQSDVSNFLAYNFDNIMALELETQDLVDNKGNVIQNVYGAFLNFVNSGYNREEWLKQHGINKGQSAQTTPKQHRNNTETKANIQIYSRGFYAIRSNQDNLVRFAVENGFTEKNAKDFMAYYLKYSPAGDTSGNIFGSDGLVINDVKSAFIAYAENKSETTPRQHLM